MNDTIFYILLFFGFLIYIITMIYLSKSSYKVEDEELRQSKPQISAHKKREIRHKKRVLKPKPKAEEEEKKKKPLPKKRSGVGTRSEWDKLYEVVEEAEETE